MTLRALAVALIHMQTKYHHAVLTLAEKVGWYRKVFKFMGLSEAQAREWEAAHIPVTRVSLNALDKALEEWVLSTTVWDLRLDRLRSVINKAHTDQLADFNARIGRPG